jgi:uncharacterized protein YwgA
MGELNKVLAYLKELKFTPKVDRFQDKLVIQKTVCLLKLMGADLGYPFSLYVRGPYSPALTTDLYANKGMVDALRTGYVPSEKEKQQLHLLCELSNNLDPTLLEIMATYAFLSKDRGMGSKEALAELKKLKPFFSEARIAVGVSRAKELFPPTEKEIQAMKAEFRDFENAALSDNKY